MTPEELGLIVQRYWSWRLEGDGKHKLKAEEVERLKETLLYTDIPKLFGEVQRLHKLAEWCRSRLTGGYAAFGHEDKRNFSVSLEAKEELNKLLGS